MRHFSLNPALSLACLCAGLIPASLLAQTVPYGNVGSAGLAADHRLDATVMPLILRGVSLLGVASTEPPTDLRDEVWRRLAGDWKPRHLGRICAGDRPGADVALHPELYHADLFRFFGIFQ